LDSFGKWLQLPPKLLHYQGEVLRRRENIKAAVRGVTVHVIAEVDNDGVEGKSEPDNGQPCRTPQRMMKPWKREPRTTILHLLWSYMLAIKVVTKEVMDNVEHIVVEDGTKGSRDAKEAERRLRRARAGGNHRGLLQQPNIVETKSLSHDAS
jgi:hypothetical protein